MTTQTLYKSYIIEEYHLEDEPYYVPVGDEVELFEAAYKQRLPLIFKGPSPVAGAIPLPTLSCPPTTASSKLNDIIIAPDFLFEFFGH